MFLFIKQDIAFGMSEKMFGQNSLLAVYTLWLREMIRFYRQPSRVLGALGTPVIFWILIGSGIGTSFRAGSTAVGVGYLHYFFPGTILMVLLFTAIFSTISLIEDRREGFLQSVLVAPIPRSSFVLGKILGGTTLAFFQGMVFLCLAPLLGVPFTPWAWMATGLVVFVNAFALTGLGFVVAWRLHSVQGFHAVMNLFLMPLWFLSGALFPQEGAPPWLRMVMKCDPLTYGMAALRMALYGGKAELESLPSFGISILVSLLFGLSMFVLASWSAGRRSIEDFG